MASNEGGAITNGSGGYQGSKLSNEADVCVDLRSDTLTKPSKEMREMMANAEVGDDVFLEDPTMKEFEERVANLLGKEAALFVSSGTQGNLICSLVHCNARGSELICGNESHIFVYEQGNISQFGGIHSNQIQNKRDGTFDLDVLKEKIRGDDVHYPITKLVCVENTHNRCGGRVLPLEWLDELSRICKGQNIPIHMDGARLMNASIASHVPPSRIVRDMSSVSVCLSKGLGAPAGSVIAGSRQFIEQARRMRKALGGGMRQTGILAAAGLYCMDRMITRLQEDHDNAKRILHIINSEKLKSVWVDPDLETNILFVNVEGISSNTFCDLLASIQNKEEERKHLGGKTVAVRCFPVSPTVVRLVTHCDVNTEMAELAARKILYVANQIKLS